ASILASHGPESFDSDSPFGPHQVVEATQCTQLGGTTNLSCLAQLRLGCSQFREDRLAGGVDVVERRDRQLRGAGLRAGTGGDVEHFVPPIISMYPASHPRPGPLQAPPC